METEGNNIRVVDAEELASLARRYYAARFPNPQRLGCPPPGDIFKIVGNRQAPDEALREHLFECSECFGEYRQALAQSRPAPDEAAWRKRLVKIFASKRPAMALAPMILILSSLSLIFIGISILRRSATEAGQTASSTPSDARPAGPGDGRGRIRPQSQSPRFRSRRGTVGRLPGLGNYWGFQRPSPRPLKSIWIITRSSAGRRWKD